MGMEWDGFDGNFCWCFRTTKGSEGFDYLDVRSVICEN